MTKRSFWKTLLALIVIALPVSGCLLPVDAAAVRNADIYFPPRFRYVESPQYCFNAAERERALQESKRMGADTLFEVVIDGEGKVELVRIVKTSQPPHREEDMLAHARVMTFSPDAESALYRGFYFPMRYTYAAEFEWVDH